MDFPDFDQDRALVLKRARDSGVQSVFVPGVKPGQWEPLARWCQSEHGLSFGLGLHPFFLSELSSAELEVALKQLPERCRTLGAVAVGEFGLDQIAAKQRGVPFELQLRVCQAQLQIAKQLELPVVLHVVRAHGKMLELLEQAELGRGGVIHAYSGASELVRRYTDLGFYFGFGGAITRPTAKRARSALEAVPAERLLLETDAPDQSPQGFAQRNEPAAVVLVAQQAAKLRGMSVPEIAALTADNARRLFG